jgi:hypothetical protein
MCTHMGMYLQALNELTSFFFLAVHQHYNQLAYCLIVLVAKL